MPIEVWQELRRVSVNGVDITADGTPRSLDMDITVSEGDDGLEFNAEMWNLSRSSWRPIRVGEPCQIQLGWAETGGARIVCDGIIEQAYTQPNEADLGYVIKGRDATMENFDIHLSKTYEQESPSAIAADLAAEAGVAPAVVHDVGATFEEFYPVQHDRPVSYWLDEMVAEAEKMTGDQYEWHADGGQFFFVNKNRGAYRDPIVLSNSSPVNLIELSPASGASTAEEGEELSFEAICLPDIRKGAPVEVSTARHGGAYKVVDYTHDSSTTAERHITSGTIVDASAEFGALTPSVMLTDSGRRQTGTGVR